MGFRLKDCGLEFKFLASAFTLWSLECKLCSAFGLGLSA